MEVTWLGGSHHPSLIALELDQELDLREGLYGHLEH